jgi:hypothetical protein
MHYKTDCCFSSGDGSSQHEFMWGECSFQFFNHMNEIFLFSKKIISTSTTTKNTSVSSNLN